MILQINDCPLNQFQSPCMLQHNNCRVNPWTALPGTCEPAAGTRIRLCTQNTANVLFINYIFLCRAEHPIAWSVHGWSSCQGSGTALEPRRALPAFPPCEDGHCQLLSSGSLLPLRSFCNVCRKISPFMLPSLCISFLLDTRSRRWGCSTTTDWPHCEGGVFSPQGAIIPYYLCTPLVFFIKRALNAFTISWVISCSINEAYNCVLLTAPH